MKPTGKNEYHPIWQIFSDTITFCPDEDEDDEQQFFQELRTQIKDCLKKEGWNTSRIFID